MKPQDIQRINGLKQKLVYFDQNIHELPGIRSEANLDAFANQLNDSIRRIKYITTIRDKTISDSITDPLLLSFNPIKAASWHKASGNLDEAFWLIFLITHFGKNHKTGWELLRNFYSGLGANVLWSWERLTDDLQAFEAWVQNNLNSFGGMRFGNHRKFESVSNMKNTITTYAEWIGGAYNHEEKFHQIRNEVGDNPTDFFHGLYESMTSVFRFGRTGRFDYLCLVGKMGLADIEPGSIYLTGATGPKEGIKLLLNAPRLRSRQIDEVMKNLCDHLDLYFGMQVLEDALCNWQKNPSLYKYFGG